MATDILSIDLNYLTPEALAQLYLMLQKLSSARWYDERMQVLDAGIRTFGHNEFLKLLDVLEDSKSQ